MGLDVTFASAWRDVEHEFASNWHQLCWGEVNHSKIFCALAAQYPRRLGSPRPPTDLLLWSKNLFALARLPAQMNVDMIPLIRLKNDRGR